MEFIIVDWNNRVLFGGDEFETQDEAWDLIYNYYSEDQSGIDDIYVVRKCNHEGRL